MRSSSLPWISCVLFVFCLHVVSHPCSPFLEGLTTTFFVSTCNDTVFHHSSSGVSVYACLAENATFVGSDSFVGRVSLARLAAAIDWDEVYPLSFDEGVSESVGAKWRCVAAPVPTLPAGQFKVSVVHEYAGSAWNPEISPLRPPNTRPVFMKNRLVISGHEPVASPLPACWNGNHSSRWVGGTWTPFECQYTDVPAAALESCANRLPGGRGVVLLGDSNMRRTAKHLFSLGAWCKHDGDTTHCNCSDDNDGGPQEKHGSALRYLWWTGSIGPGVARLTEAARFKPSMLVVGGIGAWDQAFSNTSAYLTFLADAAGVLRREFADTRLVFRTSLFYCCTIDFTRTRKFTRKRVAEFEREYVIVMKRAFPIGCGGTRVHLRSAARWTSSSAKLPRASRTTCRSAGRTGSSSKTPQF